MKEHEIYIHLYKNFKMYSSYNQINWIKSIYYNTYKKYLIVSVIFLLILNILNIKINNIFLLINILDNIIVSLDYINILYLLVSLIRAQGR
jgi:hypothetical protein